MKESAILVGIMLLVSGGVISFFGVDIQGSPDSTNEQKESAKKIMPLGLSLMAAGAITFAIPFIKKEK